MRVRAMRKIKLTREWLGHPEGSVFELQENMALALIERGSAEEIIDKEVKEPPATKVVKQKPK